MADLDVLTGLHEINKTLKQIRAVLLDIKYNTQADFESPQETRGRGGS